MDIGIELGNIAHALKALKEAKVIRTKKSSWGFRRILLQSNI